MKCFFKRLEIYMILVMSIVVFYGCSQQTDEIHEHTFGKWEIIKVATEEEEGTKERFCSLCEAKETEVIAKLEHIHKVGTKHNAVASTCTAKGNIEYYDCIKTTCSVKLDKDSNVLTSIEKQLDVANHSGKTTNWTKTISKHTEKYECCGAVKTPETDHTFGDWVITVQPSVEGKPGVKKIICSVCSYEKETAPVYFGEKKPTESKSIGDIVFNDGSATLYTPELSLTNDQKLAAVAIIFYVGMEYSRDGKNRTLGVGFKHNQIGLSWCTDESNACGATISDIDSLAYGEGELMTFTGDKDGSDNLEQIGSYLVNNNLINDTIDATKYPAFYFAENYSSVATNLGTYKTDWYLPTAAELFAIWKIKDVVDSASIQCGGSKFNIANSWYWSSSLSSSYDPTPYVFVFERGCCSTCSTSANCYVCAIREF